MNNLFIKLKKFGYYNIYYFIFLNINLYNLYNKLILKKNNNKSTILIDILFNFFIIFYFYHSFVHSFVP